jgi:hypothetical protein
MSRNDYRLVAASIKDCIELDRAFQARGDAGWRETAMKELVSTLCRTFKADNSAFKPSTFRSACGIEE